MSQALLTRREVAAQLGVAEVSVKRWTSSGALPCVRISPRVVRVSSEALEAFLARRSTRDPLEVSGAVDSKAEAL
ncbi:MAG TPA: helix-turn-helix domain-containing protein [bacterium]|nr:helix-turn-helix domain-containing protein [bacterium]